MTSLPGSAAQAARRRPEPDWALPPDLRDALERVAEAGHGSVDWGYPMSKLSWMGVGGPAGVLVQPSGAASLSLFLAAIPPSVPVMAVGACSNLIIRDGGFDGAIVRLGRGFRGFEAGADFVRAGAGLLDSRLARLAAAEGLDLAFLATIPGTVGGAVRMNAGCYGSYVADVLREATVVDRGGHAETLAAEDLGLAYRKSELPPGSVVTEAVFRAERADPGELERKIAWQSRRRDETQPPGARTCGSMFRNPAGRSSTGDPDDAHDMKAWTLIRKSGMQGARLGGARVSETHANFLVNEENATAEDLERLGRKIQRKVLRDSKVMLKWEIIIAGKPVA